MTYLFSLFLSIIPTAQSVEIWTIPQMNCLGCEEKILEIVNNLNLQNKIAKLEFSSRMLCFSTPPSDDVALVLEQRLKQNKYTVTKKTDSNE